MKYKIETIGALFSDKTISALAARFDAHAEQGYKFHTVFQIQKKGCLGIGSPTITYLAVYVKE